jgi:hypothetical protein
MDLHVTGTGNRLEILFNGDQWWLERVGSNVWELWHRDDMQPTATIENNNRKRVLAMALHRIINPGGELPPE